LRFRHAVEALGGYRRSAGVGAMASAGLALKRNLLSVFQN
jgi:hypothetical protein